MVIDDGHDELTDAQRRERARSRAVSSASAMMASASGMVSPQRIEELCKKYGVEPPAKYRDPEIRNVMLGDWLENKEGVKANGSMILIECRARTERVKAIQVEQTRVKMASALAELGYSETEGQQSTPGTPIYGGQIMAEPNPNMMPYIARGLAGSTSVYDRSLREPTTYKDYQSIRELLVTGEWHWHIPEETPEEALEEVREEVARVWARIRGARPGWSKLVEGIATCVGYGFGLHEIVWAEGEDGEIYPEKFAFMEASTVVEWLFDETQREWLGASFRAGGSAPLSWVLPATGDDLTDHRILRATLGGHGNNLEGIPPTRVINTLIVLKELLIMIIAASSERFGCPILKTWQDLAVLSGENPVQVSEAQWDELFDVIQYLQAMDTPGVKIPPGIDMDYISAAGIMPDMLPIVTYVDTSIHATFSTQAMSLSHGSSHGSNALAEVQDNDFLRSIPYYARTIAAPIDDLMRIMLEQRGVELIVYPTLHWSMPETVDVDSWLGQLERVIRIKDDLPEPVLGVALGKLGLEPTALAAEVGDDDVAVDVEMDGPRLESSQAESMLSIVKSYNSGDISRGSARAMLEILLAITPTEAEQILGTPPKEIPSDVAAEKESAENDGQNMMQTEVEI